MPEIGKLLIFLGLAILVIGLIFTFLPSLRIGRLPGDIHFRKDNWSIYIPITTSILLSVLLTLILWIISSFRR
ncbi:MAG: DUF2905 domain-containing protein [Acidobacteriota bacterium]